MKFALAMTATLSLLLAGCGMLPSGGPEAPGTVKMVGLEFKDVPLPWRLVSSSDADGTGHFEYKTDSCGWMKEKCPQVWVVSGKNYLWDEYIKNGAYVGLPACSKSSQFQAPVEKGTGAIDGHLEMRYYEAPSCKEGGGVERVWLSSGWRVIIIAQPNDKGFFPTDKFADVLTRVSLAH